MKTIGEHLIYKKVKCETMRNLSVIVLLAVKLQ